MTELLASLENSAFSIWVREAPTIWAFSTVLTLHTFGLGILVGASAVVDLRVLGVGRDVPLGSLRALFPVMWFGFWMNAVTGSMLFAAQATSRGASAFFLLKMAFVALGVATIVMLHRRLYGSGDAPALAGRGVKRLAAVSLFVWMAAITAGRLLAYIG